MGAYRRGRPCQVLLAVTTVLSAGCSGPGGNGDSRTGDDAVGRPATGPAVAMGNLEIHSPRAPVPAAGDQTALYLLIRNTGLSPDTLLSIETEEAAHVAVHRSVMEDGTVRMEPAGVLAIEAGGELVLEPGGLHGMVTGLKREAAAGDTLVVTLSFAQAGEVRLLVPLVPYAELEVGGEEVGAWRGTVLAHPLPKVDFTLLDTHGRPFHFVAETEGYVTLLFFGYTYCPDICPVHLSSIGAVMAGFSYDVGSRIKVVFVTTDPERDTPGRIREWLDAFDESFIGLRGTVAEVNDIERSLGLPPSFVGEGQDPESYLVGHAAQVLAFTPDNLAHIAYPFGIRQSDWARDLPRLVRRGFVPSDGG